MQTGKLTTHDKGQTLVAGFACTPHPRDLKVSSATFVSEQLGYYPRLRLRIELAIIIIVVVIILLVRVIFVIIANAADVVRPPALRQRLTAVWAGHRLGRFRFFRRNDLIYLWLYNRGHTRNVVVKVALLFYVASGFSEQFR
jgi:hypothetical protein